MLPKQRCAFSGYAHSLQISLQVVPYVAVVNPYSPQFPQYYAAASMAYPGWTPGFLPGQVISAQPPLCALIFINSFSPKLWATLLLYFLKEAIMSSESVHGVMQQDLAYQQQFPGPFDGQFAAGPIMGQGQFAPNPSSIFPGQLPPQPPPPAGRPQGTKLPLT